MGQWAVTIHGHGIHDNGLDHDAERMVAEFIKDLKAKGHTVNSVRFTVGNDRELTADGSWNYAP